MQLASVLALAVGLAMDATAVAAARGLAAPAIRARDVLTVAGLFGGFQAAMPLLGWLLGRALGPSVAAWDHWIAFVLLGAIGAKMIWEAWRAPDEPAPPLGLAGVVVLAIATSLDAFAAGITLPLIGAPPAVAIAAIGVVTAALSAAGFVAARRLGARAGRKLEVLGGVVLIALGTQTLVEHLA